MQSILNQMFGANIPMAVVTFGFLGLLVLTSIGRFMRHSDIAVFVIGIFMCAIAMPLTYFVLSAFVPVEFVAFIVIFSVIGGAGLTLLMIGFLVDK